LDSRLPRRFGRFAANAPVKSIVEVAPDSSGVMSGRSAQKTVVTAKVWVMVKVAENGVMIESLVVRFVTLVPSNVTENVSVKRATFWFALVSKT
jgi:hypothetical protein